MVAVEACGCFEAAPRSASFTLDRMKDPGSPTKGLSSIYSSPYRDKRLKDSARVFRSWAVELVPTCAPTKDCTLFELSASGIGVFSLLVCVCTPGCPVSEDLGAGGRYVCPCDGVKIGNVDAVLSKLVRDVTAES